jgi:putative tryptophan/tyrosine transport system substrate-binding protein
MRRREFIRLFGSIAVVVWPLTARAQQTAMPVVGYLHSETPQSVTRLLAAFRQGLSETGYVEGKNVTIEYRWARNDPSPSAAALAAQAATKTIPIVFSIGLDPVQLGLVATLNRPGGNITGVNSMRNELLAKRFALLHELLPGATRFAVLVNPKNPTTKSINSDLQSMAATTGQQIEILTASTESDIDAAFANLAQRQADALLIHPDNLFLMRPAQLIALAARTAVPVIYPFRSDAEAGGLMSYGVSLADAHRQVGVYTGRILKGEKPGDLPVVQPTKFELVINLKTAKALGFTIPPTLLARADEVIE